MQLAAALLLLVASEDEELSVSTTRWYCCGLSDLGLFIVEPTNLQGTQSWLGNKDNLAAKLGRLFRRKAGE